MAVEKSKPEGMSSEAIRMAVLITLVLQNSTQALFMRYAFKKEDEGTPKAASSTAVVMAELCKLVCSFLLQRKEDGSWQLVRRTLRDNMWNQPWDMAKMAIPAFLYTFQNNLNYLAISNLDGPTFQLLYQLKILTTALFSVTMLQRQLALKQWAALAMLALGVGLVQLSQKNSSESDETQGERRLAEGDDNPNSAQNPLLGFFFVMVACCTSGFAGVYFEKVLKGSTISLWVRNMQLSGFGVIFGLLLVYLMDREQVAERGFFFGYNFSVAMAVLLNSLGGLVVAMVVKYADNVVKGFATSVSIVLTALVSVFLLGFKITFLFVIGAYLVLHATFLYSQKKPAGNQSGSSSTAGSASKGLPKETEMVSEKESLLPPSSGAPSSPRTRKNSPLARDRDATR